MAVKEANPVLGKKGTPEDASCPYCKANTNVGKSYEEFFSDSEKKQFDQIAKDHPELEAMLPPKDANYFSVKSTKSRRDAWHRKKNKKPQTPGEFHHPHQLQVGGCPFHQDVVEVDPGDATQKKVDEQITDIVKAACARNL